MSIENAILELAKAITIHAEAIKSSGKSPWFSPESLQQIVQPDVSFDQPKQRKSKKSERTEEVVAGNVVVSVDPAKEGEDKTVVRYSEPVKTEINVTISNPPVAAKPEEEVKVGEVVIKPAINNTITSEMCKNLAKEKMASGVDRIKIKNLVTEMGAESIADLTERNLVEFYTKLENLK